MSETLPIGAKTRAFAIVGKPVRHSLSPAMQTAAFRALGIDACYLAFEVESVNLASALDGAAKLGFGGLNVTVPHKVAAFSLAAEADASALSTGAANTLVPCGGGWKAYNTDVAGFMGAVGMELGFSPRGSKAAVIGAGGAARAAVAGLLEGGASGVLVSARRLEAAHELALSFDSSGSRVKAVEAAEVPDSLGPGDLLVSATPAGLDPDGCWPWPMGRFRPGVLAFDMAYSREGATSLEREALAAGLKAASGRMMLVLQGAEAFRLWTGAEPPLEVMIGAIKAS